MMTKIIGKVIKKAKNRREMALKRRERPEHYKQVNKAAQAKFYKDHKEKVLAWNKEQREEKHDRFLERTRNQRKLRRLTDEEFVLKDRMRARLSSALRRKGAVKVGNTMDMIGCSVEHLRSLLTLRDGMQTDHIFPFECYNLHDPVYQKKVCHYSNLQSLTEDENRNKSTKLPTKAMAAKVDRSCWPDGVTEDMLPDKYDGWATPLRMAAA